MCEITKDNIKTTAAAIAGLARPAGMNDLQTAEYTVSDNVNNWKQNYKHGSATTTARQASACRCAE